MQEVKFNYQNFDLDVTAEKVTIHNKSLFTDVAAYALHLELMLDGKVIWESSSDAPHILPGEMGTVALDDLPLTNAARRRSRHRCASRRTRSGQEGL